MAGPFAGLRVIEFGRFIAAPYAAQLLADGGADVVKVEPLLGDNTRQMAPIIPGEGRQFLNKNRGKRSLAVDLGNPEALAAVQQLVATADVVIANFRPGLAEAMHLDYPTVFEANPRVIYAENTAFGRRGPMADAPGVDMVLQAYSGIAHLDEHGPRAIAAPAIDYAAGLLMSWGIATALYHRERSGHGQKLDVSLLQAALVLQNNQINHVDATDGWREEYVEYLKTAFAEGKSWEEILDHRDAISPWAVARAYYGLFRTADGVIGLGALSRPLQRSLTALLGIDDPFVSDPNWTSDDPKAHMQRVRAQVEAKLAAQPTAYWLAAIGATGVPIAEYHTTEQMLDLEQAWANGYLIRLDHELLGGITVVAPPVQFSETALEARDASPVLGKHTRELLAEAGLAPDAIDQLIATGAAVTPQ
ncbi:MAG: CoA transferase [Chloroflexi bacterium]|nr:CoA transferase [Chloroflexota bacterium]MDA1145321.1 CoA transferase [Chloroflexota bacterium]